MKSNPLILSLAALLAAVGVWFARGAWRTHRHSADPITSPGGRARLTLGPEGPGMRPQLRPPDPDRRFRELTPEQRVELARQPHGIGG